MCYHVNTYNYWCVHTHYKWQNHIYGASSPNQKDVLTYNMHNTMFTKLQKMDKVFRNYKNTQEKKVSKFHITKKFWVPSKKELKLGHTKMDFPLINN
jgi:hypothetical protein